MWKHLTSHDRKFHKGFLKFLNHCIYTLRLLWVSALTVLLFHYACNLGLCTEGFQVLKFLTLLISPATQVVRAREDVLVREACLPSSLFNVLHFVTYFGFLQRVRRPNKPYYTR